MKIDNTKEQIIKVARQVFAKFGFQKTTVNEIARAVHKAKGSVYYYFKNKEELFQSVVEKEFQTLRTELIKAINAGENAKEKLTNYIKVRMKTLNEFSNMYDALKNDYLSYMSFIEQIREKYDNEEIVLVKSILTNGVLNNEFDIEDEEQTAIVIVTALKGLELPIFINSKYIELKQRLDFMISVLIRGIEKR